MSATGRATALLRLVRFSLAPTLISDLAVGAAWAGGTDAAAIAQVLRMLPVSLMLFCGGMALNAVLDVEHDRRTRPDRPLPAGTVSAAVALGIAGFGLVGAPLLGAALAGRECASVVLALAVLIALYHVPLRRLDVVGPSALGLIRGTHFFLGAVTVAGLAEAGRDAWLGASLYGLFVLGASLVAREEDRQPRANAVTSGCLLATTALLAATLLGCRSAPLASSIPASLVLAAWFLWPLLRLCRSRSPWRQPGPLAGYLLARMPLQAALLAVAAGGWLAAGLAVMALFLVRSLVRFIPPT